MYKPKQRKCRQCGKEFVPYNPTQIVCEWSCAIEYNSEKQIKKRVKEMKKALLTHSDYTGILQKLVNLIVRNIDSNFPCISSKRFTGQMHGGHFYSTQAHPEIRFNLFNIWKQSASDNTYKSGNVNDYRANLVELYGEQAEMVFALPECYKSIKLSAYELQDKITVAKKIIKEQSNGNFIAVSQTDRITIREILNKRLGIYN